jgi:hypothetical protein
LVLRRSEPIRFERPINSATTGAWLVPVMRNRSSPETRVGLVK